jgi:RNA polymerase sigma factor
MNKNIDKKIIQIRNSNDSDKISCFIEEYKPFILNVVSDTKNAYIDVNNDDEFSIALLAFNEAINKYDISKGSFLSYSRLVIQSRLKNYWTKENKIKTVELDDNIINEKHSEDTSKIKMEILLFEQSLEDFGITIEDLVDTAPIHQATLIQSKEIGKKAEKNSEVVKYIYDKKKLPITMIANNQKISKKIIRRSKNQILAIIIVIHEGFDNIIKFVS